MASEDRLNDLVPGRSQLHAVACSWTRGWMRRHNYMRRGTITCDRSDWMEHYHATVLIVRNGFVIDPDWLR